MLFTLRPPRSAWLWWVSAVTLSIGIAVYILLKPADYDPEIQKYRSFALVASLLISGLCIIIGTSRRWFGKDL
jgi:hypothetical protein